MSEPLVIQTLTQKRAEILGLIKAHEAQIAQARHDLAHVNATIELFAAPERQRVRYMVSHGFFKKGEIADICVRHLDVDGEMTTRELAERVMAERDLEISDTALRNSVVFKVVQALRHAKRRKDRTSACAGIAATHPSRICIFTCRQAPGWDGVKACRRNSRTIKQTV